MTTQVENTQNEAEAVDDSVITVTLSKPIKFGDQEHYKVQVHEPTSAQLDKAGGRALLLLMQDKEFSKLLPRITTPQITPQMFRNMRVSDSQKLINAGLSFFADSSDVE